MSRKHKKDRTIMTSDIGTKKLRPRFSRHGRIMVGNPPKGMEDDRPSPYVKRWRTVEDDGSGNLTIKHHERPMTQDEVQTERDKVHRALNRTTSFGKKNDPKESQTMHRPKGASPQAYNRGGSK